MLYQLFIISILVGCFLNSDAQDRIFKNQGGYIDCIILNELDSMIHYKTMDGLTTHKINKKEVDIIKYQSGGVKNFVVETVDEYAKDITLKGVEKELKSDNFLNYINSIARETSASILKNITGKIDNSNYYVYFDQISFDEKKKELNIPIKISYEKYLSINNGFIQAKIIVSSDGKRNVRILNAGYDN